MNKIVGENLGFHGPAHFENTRVVAFDNYFMRGFVTIHLVVH